jgi:hypothetical protein
MATVLASGISVAISPAASTSRPTRSAHPRHSSQKDPSDPRSCGPPTEYQRPTPTFAKVQLFGGRRVEDLCGPHNADVCSSYRKQNHDVCCDQFGGIDVPIVKRAPPTPPISDDQHSVPDSACNTGTTAGFSRHPGTPDPPVRNEALQTGGEIVLFCMSDSNTSVRTSHTTFDSPNTKSRMRGTKYIPVTRRGPKAAIMNSRNSPENKKQCTPRRVMDFVLRGWSTLGRFQSAEYGTPRGIHVCPKGLRSALILAVALVYAAPRAMRAGRRGCLETGLSPASHETLRSSQNMNH